MMFRFWKTDLTIIALFAAIPFGDVYYQMYRWAVADGIVCVLIAAVVVAIRHDTSVRQRA
jgi:uncharacterized membrane protein